MRKLIVCNISSLDGYCSGVGGNPLVLNMDAAFDALNLEHMRAAGTVLLGRASFEMFSSFWPNVADAPDDPGNPALSATNRAFSRLYGEIPKLVVSDNYAMPVDNAWHDSSRVIRGSEIDGLLRIEKSGTGGDIVVFASHLLWNGLLQRGLIDELHIVLGPRAICGRIPLFTNPASLRLLCSSVLPDSENVLLSYAPESAAAA